MTPKHHLAIVALLIGFAVFLILSKPLWWKDAAPSVDPAIIERMQLRLRDLETSDQATQATMEEMLRTLRTLDRSRQSATPDGVVIDTDASTVAAPAQGESEPRSAPPGAKKDGPLTAESAFAQLTAPGVTWDDREAIWKRIREAGLLDAVIKEFEKRAKASPGDAQVQTDLGEAYLKKTEELGATAESGTYATKADRAFDRALEIDPEHWEARFVKALALSFWPPVFGKQTEAIKHFEMLVEQQERQSPRSGFAETYVMLGNMYQQMGQHDRARAAWERGLKLFPDDGDLRTQIANAGQLGQ